MKMLKTLALAMVLALTASVVEVFATQSATPEHHEHKAKGKKSGMKKRRSGKNNRKHAKKETKGKAHEAKK